MKSYEEFARSVFEKSEKLEEQNRRRRKAALAAVPSAVAAVIILTVSVILFRSGIRPELRKGASSDGAVSAPVSYSSVFPGSEGGSGADGPTFSVIAVTGTGDRTREAAGSTVSESTTVRPSGVSAAPEPAGEPVAENTRVYPTAAPVTSAPTTRLTPDNGTSARAVTEPTASVRTPVTTAAPTTSAYVTAPTTVSPTYASPTTAAPSPSSRYFPTQPATEPLSGVPGHNDINVNRFVPSRVDPSRVPEQTPTRPDESGRSPGENWIASGNWHDLDGAGAAPAGPEFQAPEGAQITDLDREVFESFVTENALEPSVINGISCYVVEMTEGDYRYYVLSRVGTDIIAMRFSGGSAEDAVRFFLENL